MLLISKWCITLDLAWHVVSDPTVRKFLFIWKNDRMESVQTNLFNLKTNLLLKMLKTITFQTYFGMELT